MTLNEMENRLQNQAHNPYKAAAPVSAMNPITKPRIP
jgi:hypothetical protein